MSNPRTTSLLLPRILLCLGVAMGALSIWDTLSHTWDPAFNAPRLPLGPTHTNYHAFREFTLSVGVVMALLYGVFLPAGKRTRPVWVVMCVVALSYYGGWWLPGPLFGLHVPNQVAMIDHLFATFLCLTGIGLAWPCFSDGNAVRED